MYRRTETFSISLPPEMMIELEQARKQEHRTRSELVREALRRYFSDRGVSASIIEYDRRVSPQTR
jgi:metal-responsive CopG/Arc/MetJ family transcriptional regulator